MERKRDTPAEEPKGPWELWWERTHPQLVEAERERRRRIDIVMREWKD